MKTRRQPEAGSRSRLAAQRIKKGCLTAAFFIIAEAEMLEGSTINYASSLNRTNLTSSGEVMGCSFKFELGVFKPGFVPTATNTSQWLASWVSARRTCYNATNRWFTASYTVTNNPPPFMVGSAGYVWGFSGCETAGEWILFRCTNWTWPAPNPESPLLLYWTAKGATTVVLGEIQNSGAFHMKSAAVTGALAPTVSWDEWRATELTVSGNGTQRDLNANGVTDVLEYALHRGANPNPGAWLEWHDTGAERYLELRIPRRRDRQATFIVEVSDDLVTWKSGSSVTEVVEDTADALVVQDRTPLGKAGNRQFMRVQTIVGN